MSRFGLDREVDLDDLGIALVRAVVGDRTGAAVFLAAVVFAGLIWRVGFFSTDNYAVANALVALSEGHLHVDRIVYGPADGATPGMHLVDGRLYARNYGLVFAGLLFLSALRSISLVADPRILLAGAWCLGVLGLVVLVGERFDRGREARIAGSAVASALFVGNAAVATPLSPRWYPVVALQAVTVIAAALTAVFVYRLLARVHGRRVGAFGGAVTALASPVAFWATIPKRHAVTAALVVVAAYGLYRSRTAPTSRDALRFRALSYVPVAITAWVHAAEALVLLAALAPLDLLSARSNRPRRLAVVAVVFLVALGPFLATNAAIGGNPLEPPRLLSGYGGDGAVLDGTVGGAETTPTQPADGGGGSGPGGAPTTATGDGTPIEGAGDTASDGDSGGSSPSHLLGLLSGLGALAVLAAERIDRFVGLLERSVSVWADPGRLVTVFLRSGYIERSDPTYSQAIDLAVIESLPVLGVLAGTPVLIWRRFEFDSSSGPERTLDAFVVVYSVLLSTLYLSRLPVHHMLTVRYLLPLYPLGIYLVARLPPIRRVLRHQPRPLLASTAATIFVGTIGYVSALAAMDAVLGEAVQLYAIAGVLFAGVAGAWSVWAVFRGDADRVGSVVLGVAVGAFTVYLLVSGLALFVYTDEFLLPGARLVAEQLWFVNPWHSLWMA